MCKKNVYKHANDHEAVSKSNGTIHLRAADQL